MPQPNFVPFNPTTSRSTQSRGMSAGTSTECDFPLTVSLYGISVPQEPYCTPLDRSWSSDAFPNQTIAISRMWTTDLNPDASGLRPVEDWGCRHLCNARAVDSNCSALVHVKGAALVKEDRQREPAVPVFARHLYFVTLFVTCE